MQREQQSQRQCERSRVRGVYAANARVASQLMDQTRRSLTDRQSQRRHLVQECKRRAFNLVRRANSSFAVPRVQKDQIVTVRDRDGVSIREQKIGDTLSAPL